VRRSRSTRWWCVVAATILIVATGVPRNLHGQWRMEVLPGVRFGPPIRAGFALGATYGSRSSIAQFAGPIVLAEGGIGGGRISAGYVLAFPFASGIEVLGSAIRTWGSPAQIGRNRTLAGGELRVLFFSVNVGVGAFKPVRDRRDDERTRYYLNVGLGI
jgi:hypothetical protein